MDIHQVKRGSALRGRFDDGFEVDYVQRIVGKILADLVDDTRLVQPLNMNGRDGRIGLADGATLF